jgi:hypothetical protein
LYKPMTETRNLKDADALLKAIQDGVFETQGKFVTSTFDVLALDKYLARPQPPAPSGEAQEQLRLTHIDWQNEMQRAETAEGEVAALLDCIVWMSGSGDFGPDALAGKEWARLRDEVVRPAMQRYAERTGAKPGPLAALAPSESPS